jgi:molecular chaperone DnaK (HSP70)
MRDFNEVLCRMSLDLDGILNVTAIEKKSGLSKHITIARASKPRAKPRLPPHANVSKTSMPPGRTTIRRRG